MMRLVSYFFILGLLILGVTSGCGQPEVSKVEANAFNTPPTYVRSQLLMERDSLLQPVRLQVIDDTLFVCYVGLPRIDRFSLDMERLSSIDLSDPGPVIPTGFCVTDSLLIVVDHGNGVVVLYSRDGEFRTSFGTLPNGQTPLYPFAVTYLGGVAYICDVNLQEILAVSMVDAEEITERGEMILQIPSDTIHTIGFPSAVEVTPDGRLLVGDAADGEINVFTCDGRFVYNFDRVPGYHSVAPQGFAMDNIPDPSMQDSSSWDPSGVRKMGRYHVVDGNNRRVHMFNSLGAYVGSYPDSEQLVQPSDIAVHRASGRLYIADPQSSRIHLYEYERQ